MRVLRQKTFSFFLWSCYSGGAACIGGALYFSAWVHNVTASLLGLRVREIFVEGRKRSSFQNIRSALGVSQGTPIFKPDLGQALKRLENLPWVRSAVVERRLPAQIYVRICEREPIAVWRNPDGKEYLIDRAGDKIIPLTPLQSATWQGTLRILGKQAPENVTELVNALANLGFQKVESALFLPSGRWDLLLKNSVRLQLPEGPVAEGLKQFLALRGSLLHDANIIDLRNPGTVFVKLNHKNSPPPLTSGSKKRL